ncbi:protein PLASTID MOVEMENT IMPAIRED 2 [Dendrobium catenatum]|uniref:Protein PLASTID MOVEMENT IMPAIRED 2 n=1 Tax=Dendrobium catenatum TaxID=906689 RepID=A0A2I0WAG6_9ASPA|nr:protein PLASTID MOVEMENT IMPAIRED 2 [Dendrobium catenatum]PKU72642.1 Protein PLASTID MOVEMENT IMPAIRED 2 [Dendrobium catenatum]
MERSSNGEGVGSLSATINFYGDQRIDGRKLEINKASISQLQNSPIQEKFSVKKLEQANRSAGQEEAPEELELFHAKKPEKHFVFKIDKSNAQVDQSLRNSTNEGEDLQYAELTQKLDGLKQELAKLKIDFSSAIESKAKALKDIEVHNQKASSSLKKVEKLRKEIEDANEEHVLVELARIEAEKEMREIVSQRAVEAIEFSKKMESTKKRISEVRREVSRAKELEEKLAATNTDVSVLQNEMELVRSMQKNFPKEISEDNINKNNDEEQLKMVDNELNKAKNELESIKEEGFQFMASMDIVRVELLQVSKETSRMKKVEKNAESTIERLNSKLLKARSKLESETLAEERTKRIVSNLSDALQQLQTEVETAKEEKEKASKETSDIKQEIEKTEMDIKYTQKQLLDKISELETVKASEAAALAKLKSMVENIVKNRAIDSQNSSMICISKWEYEYLSKKAGLANEVADKKVAAINAWIETLKAQEKEILLKSELIEKEIKAMRVAEEEEEVYNMKKSMAAQNSMGEEANEFMDILKDGKSSPRNSMTASRRWSKTRRVSAIQGTRSATRSPSFAIKRRKGDMPTFAALLRRRNGRMKQNEVNFETK